MKTIKYLFLGALLSLTTACGNDWLDLEPTTKVPSDTAIENLTGMEASLNGIYDLMRNAYYYSGRMMYYGDVTGDDAQAIETGKRTSSYYFLNYTKDNGPSTHWSYAYKIIQDCNIILGSCDKLEINEDDEDDFNDLKGQALALRGMALFDLTRFFGYPYAKDNGASLGVPIVKEISDTESKPSRSTVAECYEAIINDLKDASELLSGSFNKGKINKWATLALAS